jgi:hypothetical protein
MQRLERRARDTMRRVTLPAAGRVQRGVCGFVRAREQMLAQYGQHSRSGGVRLCLIDKVVSPWIIR